MGTRAADKSYALPHEEGIDFRTAPLRRRFAAAIIDGVLWAPLLLLNSALGDIYLPVNFIFGAVYTIGFTALLSATPGKMVLHLYVGNSDGRPIHLDRVVAFKAAGLRYLGLGAIFDLAALMNPSLAWISTLIVAVSVVMVLRDSRRRALHDRLAGTQVFLRQQRPTVEATAAQFGI